MTCKFKKLVARRVNEIELEVEMTACMNANDIRGMIDVVNSMNKSDAQLEMATTNTEDGDNATVKDFLEVMNNIKMIFNKNEVMTKKESTSVASEAEQTVLDS